MNLVILLGIVITLATGVPVLIQLLRNHPRGLFPLFFAEMWERFSYYGMRGILIFYLTQQFLFNDDKAANTYGSYTALVYLVPLLGGLLADRWLGTRKATAFGALLLVAGHFSMAFEGKPATQSLVYQNTAYELKLEGRGDDRQARLVVDGVAYEYGAGPGGGLLIKGLPAGASLPQVLPPKSYKLETKSDPLGENVFYLAVSLIIVGVGFLKPNISTIVGQLYPPGDQRRDAGFTLYYYGVNLGAFWAGILCGWLGQNVGWWAGFGLAGVGMLAGWVVFVLSKPALEGHGEPPRPEELKRPVIGPLSRESLIYLAALPAVAVVWWLVQRNAVVGAVLSFSILASLAFIAFIITFLCKTWADRQRMVLAVFLIVGAVVFWTLFEQGGTSLNLFAERNVDLNLLSAPVEWGGLVFASASQLAAQGGAQGRFWIDTGLTAAQTQSFNPGYILIFAPLFAALWTVLAARKSDPNPVIKFGLGLIQVGLGFLVVVWGAGLADASFRLPLVMLGLLYMLHTTGELCLSPVGLSQITKLSLPTVVSFMMAVYFLASSIAQFVGGRIAAMAGTETVGGEVLDPAGALKTSIGVFEKLGWGGVAVGGFFLAVGLIMAIWFKGGPSERGVAEA